MNLPLMAPPLSRRTIEQFANYVRYQLNIGECLYVPIMKIVEHVIPTLDPSFQLDTTYEGEMNNEYANYCPQTNTLSIRQDVYIAACSDDPRHRFTVAHELGHYFIHDDVTAFSRCPKNATVPTFRDPEWQANVFASEFLMSKNLITGMTAEQVALACKTSLKSAEIALKYIA